MPRRKYIDQMGTEVILPFPPRKIVSLVPSQTELLAYLDLDDQVKGITRFCVEPENWRTTKVLVGGTKDFRVSTIDAIKPDLVIGNKEENDKKGIDELRQRYPVWMSDIVSLDDALDMIMWVGEITGRVEKARALKTQIERTLNTLNKVPTRRVLYLIWRKPWMAVASGTFIHSMLHQAGLINCLKDSERYPALSEDKIKELNPDTVLLSSEPYPFREKHIGELKSILPNTRILLVDGRAFSWYGSRLRCFADYVSCLLRELQ